MREVRFHIHRKSAFAGALLPYRMYINGQYIGTIRNGKSLDANVPKAGVYYIEDDILFSRSAVIFSMNRAPVTSLSKIIFAAPASEKTRALYGW